VRIGVNTTWLGTRAGGVEVYVRNLVAALGALDRRNEYVLYSATPLPADAVTGAEHMRRVTVPESARAPFAFSRVVANAHLDIFHDQTAAPLLFGAPLVVTVHDIYHEHSRMDYSRTDFWRRRLVSAVTVYRAAAVITDSVFSRDDIIKHYRISADKIVVAPLAADPMFRLIHDSVSLFTVRERYNTGDDYILFSGALKPNKNLPRLIEAYTRLRHAGRIHHKLVLAGPAVDWLRDDIVGQARSSGYADDIIFTGRVPDADLPALYSAAALFVQPSLFEGFGLPPLEAMACGTAVVTSNTTSLPEVVGEAALTVDPTDVEALAGAMAAVLDNDRLRRKLEQAGLARASTFTWERTARIVLDTYGRVAEAQDARPHWVRQDVPGQSYGGTDPRD